MTREEALERFRSLYQTQGQNLGADELNDFENIYNQSSEAGLFSGPGYGRSIDTLLSAYAPRIEERFRPTEGRIVDSQSREAEALYGGRPEERVTSGAASLFVPPSQVPRGFAPFKVGGVDPRILSSIQSRMGGNTGFAGGRSLQSAVRPAPDYSMGAPPSQYPGYSGPAQSQDSGGFWKRAIDPLKSRTQRANQMAGRTPYSTPRQQFYPQQDRRPLEKQSYLRSSGLGLS